MTASDYRGAQAKAMTEDELQDGILEIAKAYGWLTFHPFDSRRSAPGYPDLTLVRGGRLIFAELKSAKGRVRYEQIVWLSHLRTVADHAPHVVQVFVWRPSDLLSGSVTAVLSRGKP